MSSPSPLVDRWPTVSLGQVSQMCLGKMLDAQKNRGRPQPYLRNPNIRWFDVDLSDVRLMPFEEDENVRYGLMKGDVLICEGGEAGRAAIWDGRSPDMKFQKAIHRVRCGSKLNNRFLVHRLRADYFSGRLSDYYTGATIKHLTGQDLARYRFPLPPISEQQRIAEVLDRADALRAKRRAALAQLDTLTQSIFLDMFGDPRSNPRNWQVVPLLDVVAEFRYGTSCKSGAHGTPVLRIPNVVGGDIDVSDLKLVALAPAEFERLVLVDGDVLFVRTNGNPDFVGRCAVFERSSVATSIYSPDAFVFASYLIRARLNSDKVAPVYLREFMLGLEGRRRLRAGSKTSAGQFNINTQSLGAIPVAVPPLALQTAFVQRIGALDALKGAHRVGLAQFDRLLGSLQHRAFRGEL